MQLTLSFEAGYAECYPTVREFVASRVHMQGRPQKAIAADMDLSPSHLSRKLAQSENDTSKFTCDDLERFIRVTGDLSPIYYLVEKYIAEGDRELEYLKRRLAELEGQNANKRVAKR